MCNGLRGLRVHKKILSSTTIFNIDNKQLASFLRSCVTKDGITKKMVTLHSNLLTISNFATTRQLSLVRVVVDSRSA